MSAAGYLSAARHVCRLYECQANLEKRRGYTGVGLAPVVVTAAEHQDAEELSSLRSALDSAQRELDRRPENRKYNHCLAWRSRTRPRIGAECNAYYAV
jgi:hypothetical protein